MGSAEGNYVSLTRLNPLDELRDQWIKGNERVYIHTTPFEFQKSFFFFFLIKTLTESYQAIMASRGCELKSL